jgi:hypothetical protein
MVRPPAVIMRFAPGNLALPSRRFSGRRHRFAVLARILKNALLVVAWPSRLRTSGSRGEGVLLLQAGEVSAVAGKKRRSHRAHATRSLRRDSQSRQASE